MAVRVAKIPSAKAALFHRHVSQKVPYLRTRSASSPPQEPQPPEPKSAPLQAEANVAAAPPSSTKESGKVQKGEAMQIVEGEFRDDRWVDGRWDLNQFKNAESVIDWDLVIDAEIGRRQLIVDSPIASINKSVLFDTGEIPWWAWVKRFHLPVAEKLNGRAAMIGYGLAIIGEQLSGAGLLEQQNSFFGKLLLHIAVFAVLLIQEVKDVKKYRDLIEEAFFYDRQWAATWIGKRRPSEGKDV